MNGFLQKRPDDGLFSHLVEYVRDEPSEVNAFQLFEGEWTSALPNQDGPGTHGLFDDSRISWLLDELGNLAGWKVLELGPLEGGHTYMLERAGAEVVAIEANSRAFLRCLVVKNTLNMNSKFILGDFSESFGPADRFDMVVASGVLYHMADPINLLERLAQISNRLFLWTHYWEPDIEKWHPNLRELIGTKWRPDLTEVVSVGRQRVRLVPQHYGEALAWAGFCGGPDVESKWIHRQDLEALLLGLGFDNLRVSFEASNHQNGPSACFLAQRTVEI